MSITELQAGAAVTLSHDGTSISATVVERSATVLRCEWMSGPITMRADVSLHDGETIFVWLHKTPSLTAASSSEEREQMKPSEQQIVLERKLRRAEARNVWLLQSIKERDVALLHEIPTCRGCSVHGWRTPVVAVVESVHHEGVAVGCEACLLSVADQSEITRCIAEMAATVAERDAPTSNRNEVDTNP